MNKPYEASQQSMLSIRNATSWFIILPRSFQLTFATLLQIHISKASNRDFTDFFIVHVSHPYRSTVHTRIFSLFLNDRYLLLVINFFLLIYACFAIAILHLISSSHPPSSLICCSKIFKLLYLLYFVLPYLDVCNLMACFGNNYRFWLCLAKLIFFRLKCTCIIYICIIFIF